MPDFNLNMFSINEGLTDKKKGKCEDTPRQLKPNNSYELTILVFIIFAIIISATFGVAVANSSKSTNGTNGFSRLPGWLFFICLCGMGSGILSGYIFKNVI